MNEQAIVKFLAEQMPSEQLKIGEHSYTVVLSDKADTAEIFDPINKIEHAWLVVEWMRANRPPEYEFETFVFYVAEETKATFNDWETSVWNVLMDLNPKIICIAAVKALSTDRWLKELRS